MKLDYLFYLASVQGYSVPSVEISGVVSHSLARTALVRAYDKRLVVHMFAAAPQEARQTTLVLLRDHCSGYHIILL